MITVFKQYLRNKDCCKSGFLSLWMRVLTDEKSWQEETNTFRSWFTQLAGKMVHSGRQVYLKMYEAYHYKERWRKIDGRIDNLQFA